MDTIALRNSLRQALVEYRDRRPNLSLRAIARNSGVNRYFLNKILEEPKEGDASPLDLNQVLLFLKFVTKKNTLGAIMESSSEDVRNLITSIFPHPTIHSEIKESTKDLNLYDYNTYYIMHFAAFNKDGINRDLVAKILGIGALKTLDQLIEHNIVAEEDGRVRIVGEPNFFYGPDIVRHHFGHYSRFFDVTRLGQNRNFISTITQGVTLEALQRIQGIYLDAYKKTAIIMADPKNWGDLPAFAISCVDTFVDDTQTEDQ